MEIEVLLGIIKQTIEKHGCKVDPPNEHGYYLEFDDKQAIAWRVTVEQLYNGNDD
jgi:hypothetical protein